MGSAVLPIIHIFRRKINRVQVESRVPLATRVQLGQPALCIGGCSRVHMPSTARHCAHGAAPFAHAIQLSACVKRRACPLQACAMGTSSAVQWGLLQGAHAEHREALCTRGCSLCTRVSDGSMCKETRCPPARVCNKEPPPLRNCVQGTPCAAGSSPCCTALTIYVIQRSA